MNAAAWLASDQGDSADADALLEQSIAQRRPMHDTVGEAWALVLSRPQQARGR